MVLFVPRIVWFRRNHSDLHSNQQGLQQYFNIIYLSSSCHIQGLSPDISYLLLLYVIDCFDELFGLEFWKWLTWVKKHTDSKNDSQFIIRETLDHEPLRLTKGVSYSQCRPTDKRQPFKFQLVSKTRKWATLVCYHSI